MLIRILLDSLKGMESLALRLAELDAALLEEGLARRAASALALGAALLAARLELTFGAGSRIGMVTCQDSRGYRQILASDCFDSHP